MIQVGKAIVDFNEAIHLDPKDADAYVPLVRMLITGTPGAAEAVMCGHDPAVFTGSSPAHHPKINSEAALLALRRVRRNRTVLAMGTNIRIQ